MARPVYSSRFIQQRGLSSSTSFAVPSGFIAVVRDLDAYCDATLGFADLFLEGATGQAIAWHHWDATTQDQFQWRGRQVYEPGELIVVTASTGIGVGVDVTVCGYLLTLS